MVIFITVLLSIYIVVQMLYYIRKSLYRELAVFFIIMAVVILYSYSSLLEWEIMGPDEIIKNIYKPLAKIVFPNYKE